MNDTEPIDSDLIARILDVFRPEFRDSIDEIEHALKKENTAGYDYRKAIVDYTSTDSGSDGRFRLSCAPP